MNGLCTTTPGLMSSEVLIGVVEWKDPLGKGLGIVLKLTLPLGSPAVAWPAGNARGALLVDGLGIACICLASGYREGYLRVRALCCACCRNYAWGDLRVILVSSVGRHGCAHRGSLSLS